jgi:hypothetical protein
MWAFLCSHADIQSNHNPEIKPTHGPSAKTSCKARNHRELELSIWRICVFNKDFYQVRTLPIILHPITDLTFKVYEGVDFLKYEIEIMKTSDFRRRPTAQIALQGWLETKTKLDISMARWRLRRRDEFLGLRVMRDAVSVVQQSFDNVTRMLNPQVST